MLFIEEEEEKKSKIIKKTFLKIVKKVVRSLTNKKKRGNSKKKQKKTLSYHLMCNLINIIVIWMLIDGDKMQAKKHGEKWIILKENLRSDAKKNNSFKSK